MGGGATGATGADVEALTVMAREFGRAAATLSSHRRALSAAVERSPWTGSDAERHRSDWVATLGPSMAVAARFVERLGVELQRQADEQRSASAVARPGRGAAAVRPVLSVVGLRTGWFDDIGDALDRMVVAAREAAGAGPTSIPADIVGNRMTTFDVPATPRQAVVDAMEGLAQDDRIRRDEIEIRALDSGRYIVVLPGVTDLSDGVGEFVGRLRATPFDLSGAGRVAVDSWADNDEPTVRKMRYAYDAARRDDSSPNEYSAVALAAIRSAGVPRGAEVMLVGHSFGAYAAVDLAADPAVNSAHGTEPSGYHLEVTHVIAAGAETDWRFDELPAGTRTLVLNNRLDAVYRAEDLLHRDGAAVHPGHVEHNFWGGWSGAGHDERHYIDRVAAVRDGEVADWLGDAGRRYRAGGVRVSARVPDPNL